MGYGSSNGFFVCNWKDAGGMQRPIGLRFDFPGT